MNFARIINNVAVDVSTDPSSQFHADIAADFVSVPDTVRPQWRLVGGTWQAPDASSSLVTVYPILTPMTFYLAFTPEERRLIKASTDQQVKEFWETFQLAVQLGKDIDTNLVSVREAVAYLAQKSDDTPPGPGILASTDRIPEILSGIPQ